MSLVSAISKGQPIDASFIVDMSTAIDNLATKVDTKKGIAYVQSDPSTKNAITKSTANVSFFASVVKVKLNSETVNQTSSDTFSIDFGTGVTFDGPPVVTATPVIATDASVAAKSASVVLSEITKAGCTATVTYGVAGSIKDLYLHVIAIGVTP